MKTSMVCARQVAVVEQRLFCQVCDPVVEMTCLSTTCTEIGSPTIYAHRCSQCGNVEHLEASYPQTVEVPVGEWEEI